MHELISPTINFAILVGILVYFLRKPIVDMVAARRSAIESQLGAARAQTAAAEKSYNEFSAKLKSFEAEASTMLERARAESEALKSKIVADAKATAARIVSEAESTALANVQDFKDGVRRETIARAIEVAEKTIRERLSTDDHRRIVHEYVGKVE